MVLVGIEFSQLFRVPEGWIETGGFNDGQVQCGKSPCRMNSE